MPEFYTFLRKKPEFYIILTRKKIFSGIFEGVVGKATPLSPIFYAYGWAPGPPPAKSGPEATDFKFCTHLYSQSRSEQKPMKKIRRSSRGRSQGVPKIFRAPIYIGRIARSSLR